jgi:tetratricopeptide (TPR) repeat protein
MPYFCIVKRLITIILLLTIVSIPNQAQILLKISDFFRNPIEFRTPFTVLPFEIKIGTQFLGMGSQPLVFDSTESAFERYNALFNRNSFNFELELAKINGLLYLLPQNFIDFPTGVGIRYTNALARLGLPNNWPGNHPLTQEKLYLNPRMREYFISQSAIFQWSTRWYGYLSFNYGWAHATAYVSERDKHYLPQDGHTYTFTLGLKYLGSPGFRLKESFGIELKYTLAQMNKVKDPDNLSPITSLNLNSLGINLTFAANLGGSRTQADDAKELYRQGDFLAAKANLNEFLERYPHHPKRFKAEWLRRDCEIRVPFQEVVLGEEYLKVQNYSQAIEHLKLAQQTTNTAILLRIENDFQKITAWFQNSMDSLIQANAIEAATTLLTTFEGYQVPKTVELTDRYWSEIWFHRGAVFTTYGWWEKAIDAFDKAIGKYPPIRERVDPWLLKIAHGYIHDTNAALDKSSLALALESLRQATIIRPEIGAITKPYVTTLEESINYLKRQAGLTKLHQTVEQLRHPPSPRQQPTTGMPMDTVQILLGQPIYRNSIQDNAGRQFELWIYSDSQSKYQYLYFLNRKLYKLETGLPPGTALEE